MPTRTATYDYVVVGAGSAGCLLANRLSADPDTTVLLLEAGGPDESRNVRIPAAFSKLFKSEYDWDYSTAPQEHMGGRELYWPRGKTLGGSSAINAMIYIRGHPHDYDTWAERGNEGWGYDDVLPYFKRGEHADSDRLEEEYHGNTGELNVTDVRSPRPLSEAFVESAAAAGYRRNDDFNGARQAGVGPYHVTHEKGKRHSAAEAYLKPVLDRPNLTAHTGAHVTRVRFDGTAATGVEYSRDGKRLVADAAEEVVLSAGAVDTPQLLMLSGVGDADHLAEHDVEVVNDLPGVGKNLQDHLFSFALFEADTEDTLENAERLRNLAKYFLLKRGPLTSNVAEAGGFVRTDEDEPAPDVQFHFAPGYFFNHGLDEPEVDNGFSVGVTQLRPESRGEIRLSSGDPLADPVIDPNYFDADRDMEVHIEGVRAVRDIVEHGPLADLNAGEIKPGPDAQSDEELAEAIREGAETVYHPVGTCMMGDGDDAVVDDRLRVHGVENLRVVDASVMPTLTGGNTNAPTYAIAEKAAAMLRD
ncbi:GMC family oxidoreductase [Halosegnis marinus]|uniref:GMC family oxidoreductase n=1 Tax=Halosegnis marinus TaxID=3034023 RepID=A0ABD5ZK02_9EURY|nr:choline dehydrogenase [Halosegnis sp. DT85]